LLLPPHLRKKEMRIKMKESRRRSYDCQKNSTCKMSLKKSSLSLFSNLSESRNEILFKGVDL
jgi:hypothetical protein